MRTDCYSFDLRAASVGELWHAPLVSFTTRELLKGLVLALTAGAGRASAQAWPSRPLRLVVPFSAGAGILDIMARLISQRLSAGLGQQVVVDNKPGAGGNVGADIAAKAAPDGYTFLIAGPALAVSPYLYAHLDFDPIKDFAGVTMINSAPLLLVVHPSLPFRSVAELIAYAKANPGRLNYGSGGVGATPYLAAELLKSMAGFDAVHVPYKGGAPALADLVAGQLSFMIENVPGTLPFVKDGKLRALAITSRERSALVPDLPTINESGVPGYEMIGWNGIFLPRGAPAEIVARLHGELAKVLRDEELRAQFAKLGAEAVGNSPVEFAAFFKEESERWGKIIRELGIKPE
jgi:tripartite-type tricarboxylate transporter receptor subunit TctC